MAKLTFELREPNKEVLQPINCIVRFGNDRVKFSTGFFIKPSQWNFTEREPKSRIVFSGKQDIVNRLDSIKEELKKLNTYLTNEKITPSAKFVKQYFEDFLTPKVIEEVSINPKETPTQKLFREIGKYIQDGRDGIRKNEGKPLAYRSIQRYNTVRDRLIEFSESYDREMSLKTIDEVFYNDYVKWLEQTKTLAQNTIWKDVTSIKALMNYFLEEGIIAKLPYRKGKFKSVWQDVDKIYLSLNEIKAIEDLNLSENKRLERVRDIFVIGCYTGFRISDMLSLSKSNFFRDNEGKEFITLTQIKTKYPVIVPVLGKVGVILERYNYEIPQISEQEINRILKEVGQLAGLEQSVSISNKIGGIMTTETIEKYKKISFHTARRSFATNSFHIGIDPLLIRTMTGHKTERAFMTYIRLDGLDKAKLFSGAWDKFEEERKNIIKLPKTA